MKKDPLKEVMDNIDWNRIILTVIPVLQPVLIFGAWLLFAKFDKRADAVSKFIAIAEPIPTIDLNLPKPVVLASLFHSIDEALDILEEVIKFIKEIEVPTAEEIIEEVKEEIKEEITEPIVEAVDEILPDDPAFKTALANCVMNAKDNLGYAYYLLGPTWIQTCMLRKGMSIGVDKIKEKFF